MKNNNEKNTERKRPTLVMSVIALAGVSVVLAVGIHFAVPVIVLMLVNILLLTFISLMIKVPYKTVEEGMFKGIREAIVTPIILISAGVMIASWIQCGTVPMLVYYGLGLMNMKIVLPLTFLMCGMLSVCIGTSWGTTGTVGIACVSIGVSMGIPLPMMVGAAISGAIFGDKLSPLSDTTILASTTSEINIFSHVRAMAQTAIPAFVLCLIAYYFLGLPYANQGMDVSVIEEVRSALSENFKFSPFLLLPMLMIVTMSLLKCPAIPTILLSGMMGGLMAILVQGESLASALTVMSTGFSAQTGVALVDTMLSKGGITSMLSTVAVSILALGMGGILDTVGYLEPIVSRIASRLKSDRAVIIVTVIVGVAIVTLVTNFSVVMVLMGSMFRRLYDERDIHRSVLSRSMEDATTLMLPIIPWNTSCIYYMSLFGMTSPDFAPYVFFCWGNLIVSMGATAFGLLIRKVKSPEEKLPGAM